MSDTTAEPFDVKAIMASIDRDLAEAGKLREETRKFVAEQPKWMADGNKLNRDRWLAPILATVSVIGGLAGFLSILITALHLGR